MKKLIKMLKITFYTSALSVGLIYYLVTKNTLAFSYQAMIHLFCLTGGKSNDILSILIGFFNKKYYFGTAKGVLQVSDKKKREIVLKSLKENGYHVFDHRLSTEICNKLRNFALNHPCLSRSDLSDANLICYDVYQRDHPHSVRYDFDAQDLLQNRDIQHLLSDISLVAVAQDYLGSRPYIDVLSMWWHTAYSDEPDAAAAQYYHFDMDRPKWIKFFIYLTDVGVDNGPHTFVKGSHKTGGITQDLLKKGYQRLTDEEISNCYGKDKIIEFAAPMGTIIAEDTRGLHKGKHVGNGDRLILQIQFSNSLFGGCYPNSKINTIFISELEESVSKYPKVYSSYI
jgi:hypothetical protein